MSYYNIVIKRLRCCNFNFIKLNSMKKNRFMNKYILVLLFCVLGLVSCGDKNKIPTNEIHYTTIDNSVLPFNFDEGRIVSNSYVPDKNVCILKLDKDVTEIENRGFSACSSLKSITIPPSVTKIGESAFSGCSSLTEVRIPKECNVDESAFEDSPNVKIIRY